MASEAEIEAAAAAINELCETDEDAAQAGTLARAALEAAERVREPIVFVTADGSHRCTVFGRGNICVEKLPLLSTAVRADEL